MNVIVELEFGLAYYNVAVQHFHYYGKRSAFSKIGLNTSVRRKIYEKYLCKFVSGQPVNLLLQILSVMAIVVGNGIGNPSSNPG